MARAENQNFWSTIPGILTGVAAFITAVTGLWVAIAHNKPEATEHETPAAITAPASSAPAATGTSAASAAQAGTPAVQASTVTVTSRDGNTTKLGAKNFIHNYTEHAIELTSGQTIAFEKLKAIDFLTVHPDEHTVDVSITLTDGRAVTGVLKTNYAFTGESDLGPFTIFVQDVKQIAFGR